MDRRLVSRKSDRKSLYTHAIFMGILVCAFSCPAARLTIASETNALSTTPGKINALPMTGGMISNISGPTGITPFLDCVSFDAADNTLTAIFGYVSANTGNVQVPVGTNNFFAPSPIGRGQTTTFFPGMNHEAFEIAFPLDSTSSITWTLLGQSVTASNDPSLYCSPSTSFTYQGRLTDSGKSANGTYDLQFTLYDDLTAGHQQGSPSVITKPGVNVTNGIFTVQLDFGNKVVSGLFLEIGAKHPADASFTILSPRQAINAVPFATRSGLADSVVSISGQSPDNVALATTMVLNGNVPSGSSNYIQNTTTQQAGSNFNISGSGTVGGNLTVTGALNATLPAGSGNYIQNSTTQQINSNFNISGNGTVGGTLSAGNISGDGSGLSNVPGTLRWQVVTGTTQQALPNNGYVANNASQVTITLPANPNLGDVVRVSGLGSGGWKIAQNAGQSVLGSSLNLYGINWTPHDSNRSWFSVASSADGSELVAAVFGGQIYTSTDSGVTWTPRDSTRNWESVASSADGSKLVAVVFGGQIYTSTDSGATWTPRDSNRSWQSVASSADGSKLVAVVFNGQVYTSIDSGVTWTPRDSTRGWFSVASSADGSKLVAAVNGRQIYTSTDSGATWTPRDSNRNWFGVASSADGGKLVAVADGGQIYTSTDSGATWTPRDSTRNWSSVASSADGSKLVAVVDGGQIYTSTDSGITWTPRDSTRNWISVASSADGSKLVAAVQSGQLYTSALTAASTTTPGAGGYLVGGQFSSIELQYIGNGQFMVISHEGTIVGF
ncbi:MAG TPA: hypothetical protein VFC63_23585 [Blastocatellia bacterium]|nr:hypothetical protein [Blastocatellia bacterium]